MPSETVVPPPIRRWSDVNAALALAALVGSTLLDTTLPSVIVGVLSLGVFALTQGTRGIANALTALRLLLLSSAGIVFSEEPVALAAIFALVLVLDGVDGWAARRFGEASPFGAHFDMETDAYMVNLLCLTLVTQRGYGAWALLPGALRYLYVLARAVLPSGPPRERRSQVARWIFVVLSTSLLVALLPQSGRAGKAYFALGVASVCLSFAPYFFELGKGVRLRRKAAGSPP